MEWKPFLLTLLAFLALIIQTESTDSTDIKGAYDDLSLQGSDSSQPDRQSEDIVDENALDTDELDDLLKRGSLFRFGKRGGSLLRFGKRGSLLRFGKRGSLLRFGKRGSSSLFRYGKRDPSDVYDLLSNGDSKRTILRYGKRADDMDSFDVEDYLNRYNKRQNILRYGRSADKRPHTPFRFGREEDE
ncbi:FMRFamide-related peptides type HF-4-like isoform X2 [Liolophura sinensis]